MKIKNLTQLFVIGIFTGGIIASSIIYFVNNVFGLNYLWAAILVVTIGAATQFYSKLKRCQ